MDGTHAAEDILLALSRGRTDRIFELLDLADWRTILHEGQVKPLQWLVYYDDVTALEAVVRAGGDLRSIDLNAELRNAAFFGHWKVCDFLLERGADPNDPVPGTGESPLHCALCKAGRPYYLFTVRLLLKAGADPNARTIAGSETDGFMRDVRNKGETPLHRAAAYGSAEIVGLLLEHGADREARDAAGDSPLSWASAHLRPGRILQMLAFEPHRVSDGFVARSTSDHGSGWGNAMDWNLYGDYLPRSRSDRSDREPAGGEQAGGFGEDEDGDEA